MAAPGSPAPTADRTPHAPQRRCVVCRRSAAKAELGRIARTPAGDLALGGADGRGAYVCRGQCAAALAADSRPLARALRTSISPQLIEQISRAYGPGQETT